jgi:formylglycine-generating enzyme required for sulfatase activity
MTSRLITCIVSAACFLPAAQPNSADAEGAAKFTADSMLGKEAGQVRDDNGLKMKLVWCPPGKFTMGSPRSESPRAENENQADVTLTTGFWLGKYEATQSEWKRVMSTEPWKNTGSTKSGDDYPASVISWFAATEFCRKFTEQERAAGRLPNNWEYTLPTEAQWEYACRAGTTTRYYSGSSGSQLREYAWILDNTRKQNEAFAHRVGQKKPNPWGLHDTHGNVSEWCRDVYATRLRGGVDPEFTKGALLRVIRGGNWDSEPQECRSAQRGSNSPGSKFDNYGLRVACSPVR